VIKKSSPETYSTQKTAHRVIKHTEKRFSIIYRMAFVMISFVVLSGIAFPHLNALPKTLLSALTGIGTIIVGIAARPFLENLIAGIQISFAKPFKIGDTVIIDENYGTVEDITLTHTIIKRWDWPRYIVPNSLMQTKSFLNYTNKDRFLWAHVVFRVAYGTQVDQVREIAVQCTQTTGFAVENEEIYFWVTDMADDGIECWVAAWTLSPSDAWMHKVALRENLVQRLAEEKIRFRMHHIKIL
jgi:small-conductance mechanosensitive channel